MTSLDEALTIALVAAGTLFYIAGTAGLLRFPDLYTRLHAMTKADNVGLGFIVAGLALQTSTWTALGQLLIIWFLVLLSSASSTHLLARGAAERGVKPWRKS